MLQTFEYCSLHYLNQWLTHDKNYCHILSKGNTEEKLLVLKNAGGFYRVARNLPKSFDEGNGVKRYQPVLNILEEVLSKQFEVNPVKRILEIEKKISEQYGNRSVLSLTTKFLWLKVKSPILIYDAQARIAVGSNNGDLSTYYDNWHSEFEKHKEEIECACYNLGELHLYATDQNIGTKKYIEEITSNAWFHERVFDIYLWSKGNNA